MAEYEEDQIEFSILSLVRDPTLDHIEKLALNVKLIGTVNRCLAELEESRLESSLELTGLESTIIGPDASFELTQETIDRVAVPTEEAQRYQTYAVSELLQLRRNLCESQRDLRIAIREEQESRRSDDDYAVGRRFDYGPAIRAWIRFLARKKVIKDLAALSQY